MDKFIHIGANKAASTTLQRHLFNKSEDLSYFGEDCVDYLIYKDFFDTLISDDDFHFSLTEAKRIFQSRIEDSNKKTFIFSSEDILTSRIPSQCAIRLHKLLPDANILIIIRNQIEAIASWYANHGAYLKQVPKSYWRRYVSFEDWIDHCFSFQKYSPLESFLYHKHLSLYRDLFGKDNIHILFFEDLIYSKNTFVSQLSNILKIDSKKTNELLKERHERQRNSKRQHMYHKFKSNYFHNMPITSIIPYSQRLRSIWNKYLLSGDKFSVTINAKWRNMLVEYYSNDNRMLSKEYSIDIERYSYPVK
jgi:hypothetical protein